MTGVLDVVETMDAVRDCWLASDSVEKKMLSGRIECRDRRSMCCRRSARTSVVETGCCVENQKRIVGRERRKGRRMRD